MLDHQRNIDYNLGKDDCWHLDAPHDVAIKLKIGGEEKVIDEYKRVGINAREAWKLTKGEGVRVVIFDTGVEVEHPDLRPNIDFGSAQDFDHSIDGSGRAIRRPGSGTSARETGGYAGRSGEGEPQAGEGRIDNKHDAHGTACAGIVGAVGLPDARVVGVAPGCTLVPIRISTNFEIDALLGALDHAAKNGDVILIPRFFAWPDEMKKALAEPGAKPSEQDEKLHKLDQALRKLAKEKPIICASGNDGSDELIYPARLEEVIAVGACNEKGYRATYSQYGEGLDVVAPSNDVPNEDRELVRLDEDEVERRVREQRELQRRRAGAPEPAWEQITREELIEASGAKGWNLDRLGVLAIATTDNLGPFGYNIEPEGDYCQPAGNYGFGGTSAAAAQVAGVVALMLSARLAHKKSFADLTPEIIKSLLRETASMDALRTEAARGTPEYKDKTRPEWLERPDPDFGAGLVDALEAVKAALAR